MALRLFLIEDEAKFPDELLESKAGYKLNYRGRVFIWEVRN